MSCFRGVSTNDDFLETLERYHGEKPAVDTLDDEEKEQRLRDLRVHIKEAKVDWW